MVMHSRNDEMNSHWCDCDIIDALLSEANESFVIVAPSGSIMGASRAFCDIFGQSKEGIAGTDIRDWLRLMDEGATESWEDLRQCVVRKQSCNGIEFSKQGPRGQRVFKVSARLAECTGENETEAVVAFWRESDGYEQAESSLAFRAELQSLIVSISKHFISFGLIDFDYSVNRALKEIGTFLGADRVYIFSCDDELREAVNSHEWCAEGVNSRMNGSEALSFREEFPALSEEILRRRPIYLCGGCCASPDIASERERFRSADALSMLLIPMEIEGRLNGLLGFDVLGCECSHLDGETISLLAVAAETIACARERARMISDIQASKEQLQLVLQGADLGFWDWDKPSGNVTVNERLPEILGYSASDFEPHVRMWERLRHPDEQDSVNEAWEDHLAGKAKFYEVERRLRTKSGEWKWILSRGRVVKWDDEGRPIRITGTHLDIDAQKRSEERITKLNECFLGFTADPLKNISRLTAVCGELMNAACAIYNRLEANDILSSWGQWQTPPDYNPVDRPEGHICYDVIQRGSEEVLVVRDLQNSHYAETDPNVRPFKLETYIGLGVRCGDEFVGSLCVVYQKDVIPNEEDKKLFGILAAAVGIEEKRILADAALRASEKKYRSIFENIQDVYYEASLGGKLTELSPSVAQISKYSREELLGKSISELCVSLKDGMRLMKAILDEGIVTDYELMLLDKDRSGVPCSINARLLTDEKGKPWKICGVLRDISRRKHLEEQLRHSQKMEAVGELAGGIAHDFNNLLTGILGHASLIKLDSEAGSDVYDSAETIEKTAERASELTRQLLGYAQKGKQQVVPIDIHRTIHEVGKLISRSFDPNIRICLSLDAPNATVMGDPGQIQQVLMNLFVNARDAMPKGGELNVSTRIYELKKSDRERRRELPSGRYIAIYVADTGKGIPEEMHSRVFEPFFTTKKQGRGTGMGLAVVYGIVSNHGGDVRLKSSTGKGTTFTVLLPLEENRTPEFPARSTIGPLGGNERILLVDDEAVVRKSASRTLRRLGYQVEVVSSGEEALKFYSEHQGEVDLVIIDMIMPGMGGPECFEALKGIYPEVKAIISTGYSIDGDAQRMLNAGAKGLIQKPFQLSVFAATVREVLDEEREVECKK
ncbi:MAG: PAS domain S-box protein [Candidatus Coatesbacteria bacterium]|nr:PAS domain S-box protein [Candidatus Coatesbacteria bacterium]